jgi:hypothetical protein
MMIPRCSSEYRGDGIVESDVDQGWFYKRSACYNKLFAIYVLLNLNWGHPYLLNPIEGSLAKETHAPAPV